MAVLKAAQEGCPFCSLLVASLEESSREQMTKSYWVRIYFDTGEQVQNGGFRAAQGDTGLGVRWLRVILCSTLLPVRIIETEDSNSILHVAADKGNYGRHTP